jgi:3-phosphoshikimate 1-carboxyvinyltransferase
VRPPGSKSLTNRALITAALASGTTTLTGVLDSDDTRVMVDSLRKLGMQVDHDVAAHKMTVTGCGGKPGQPSGDLWLENSGTSIRFLTALCALGDGTYRLDGNKRMRERPIDDLVDALRILGVEVECELGTRCPPVLVHAKGLVGGKTEIDGDVSSQFLSGLLIAR